MQRPTTTSRMQSYVPARTGAEFPRPEYYDENDAPSMDSWKELGFLTASTPESYPRPMTVYLRPQEPQFSARRPNHRKRHRNTQVYRDPPQEDLQRGDEVSKRFDFENKATGEKKSSRNPFVFLFEMYGELPEDAKALEIGQSVPVTHPIGWKRFLILLSGAIPYIVVVLDDTIIATIIPVLVSEFEQPADIGWYASAYFLPLTVLMPVFGKCYSLWKIKWLFVISLLILLGGSIACATTTSSPMFIAGRAIAGAGAAGIVNGAMRIVGVSSSRKERTFLEAAGALVMGACTVAGPLLGGIIADHFGWRWAFWLNVPIAIGALVIVLSVFPAQPDTTALFRLPWAEKLRRLDPLGSLALIGALGCLIALLESLATTFNELSMLDQNLALLAGMLFVIFLVHEAYVRADLALVPRRLLRHRGVWSCCIMIFFLFASFINFVFFLSLFFQSVKGVTAQQSAINLLPYVASVSAGAAIVGVLVSFVQYYNAFFVVGGVFFALGAGLIFTLDDTTTTVQTALYESVLGLGAGFVMLGNVAPLHTQLEQKDHSEANGFLFLSSLLGATLSLPISNALFNHNLIQQTLALGIPAEAKTALISDPTNIHSTISAESLPVVLVALADSFRATFLLGLVCAVACAISTVLVPFKRLILEEPTADKARETTIVKNLRRMTAGSVVTTIWMQQSLSEMPQNLDNHHG